MSRLRSEELDLDLDSILILDLESAQITKSRF